MNQNQLGKWIMSFVLVVGAVVATAVDWNTTHLFNPDWHPHARFHDALFLLFLDGMSLVALWLLWRQSKEPGLGLKVAALFSAAVWTPFFYIEALIPGTSLLAADNIPALEGPAFHWRRSDGFGRGVFAANAGRDSLRAIPNYHALHPPSLRHVRFAVGSPIDNQRHAVCGQMPHNE